MRSWRRRDWRAAGDELGAEETGSIRLPRPQQTPGHARVRKRLAHALRLGVAQHAVDGRLGAAEALVDVVRAAAGALDELDADLRVRAETP